MPAYGSSVQIKPVGDCGALVVFGTEISESINRQVAALTVAIQDAHPVGVYETVPAFASLLVCYNPLLTDFFTLRDLLWEIANRPIADTAASGKTVELPVCYGGEYGPDLAFVAQHAGLTEEEVIRLHSGRSYRIYMLGFLPGFPYLGGLDKRLFTPRLQTPRTIIPAGSVGIGGEQTGVYPLASPGGWQLLGRTPLPLFTPGRPLPYAAGDSIRFVPITSQDFERLAGEAQKSGN